MKSEKHSLSDELLLDEEEEELEEDELPLCLRDGSFFGSFFFGSSFLGCWSSYLKSKSSPSNIMSSSSGCGSGTAVTGYYF